MLTEETQEISFRAGRISAAVLRNVIRLAVKGGKGAVRRVTSPEHGQISLKKLDAQGRQLESVKLDGQEDLRAIQRQMKKYHVDFSLYKEKGTNTYRLFFKAQDIDRIHLAMEQCVSDFEKSKGRQPMDKQLDAAAKEAQERNAAAAEKAMERAASKTVAKEATL